MKILWSFDTKSLTAYLGSFAELTRCLSPSLKLAIRNLWLRILTAKMASISCLIFILVISV